MKSLLLVSIVTTVHEKSMWGALKGLSYWFFIDTDQSIYQWLQEGRHEHWKRRRGCTTAVMDCWKGNVQNVLCLVCALHFKGSAQENGSCQHLQTCSEKMQPYCMKKQDPREKNHITLSLKHHRAMKKHLRAHSLLYIRLPLSVCDEVNKKKTTPASSCPLRLALQIVACLRVLGFCEAAGLFIWGV